ncbi:hypothetical protein JI721_12760 [Alicyclobacillus cycloheptanicus]|uniref:Uncharacterized protein n=1 Tax=Alicyclobacillus cycloheptanicus TaxID=1457 RepID=A0ABT9XEP4_9BACL|nr:hypothetical protein [Alicyclobacillus cycloheptanicus]MDQ0188772.1 hypothetical protein [Alicyclobacillus cycloheptanicus]WDM00571.1 hypothetical protein JI721_12760 [Alicyclobacillus cycloheptanicus]
MPRQTRISAEAFAKQLFSKIRTDLPEGAAIPPEKRDRVSNELVYFSIFLIDLGVYLVMQSSPNRQPMMDHFWDLVNASGISMDFLNLRLQTYTEAAKADSRAEALNKLGQSFAWQCLMPSDSDVAAMGSRVAAQVTDEIVAMTLAHEIVL